MCRLHRAEGIRRGRDRNAAAPVAGVRRQWVARCAGAACAHSPGEQTLFRVATRLSATRVPTTADVQRVFDRANDILFQKTTERMVQTGLVSVGPGSPLSHATAYASAHSSPPPDGVIVFSDDSTATAFGGYSQTFLLPAPNVNRFPPPVVGGNRGYVAVVHLFHR